MFGLCIKGVWQLLNQAGSMGIMKGCNMRVSIGGGPVGRPVSEAETLRLKLYQRQRIDYFQITVAMERANRYELSHAGFEKGLPFYLDAHAKLAQLPGPDTDERLRLTANAKRGYAYCLSKVYPTPASDEICIPMFMDAAKLFDRIPASLDKAFFYSDLGQYYRNKPSPDLRVAGDHLRRAEQELAPFKATHSRIHFFILNALGRYYFQTADYPKCLAYFSQACAVLTHEPDKKNKESFWVRQHLYLSRTHEKLGDMDKQSEMLAKATDLAKRYAIDMATFSQGVGL
jgi:tetratricopeptide (TPR) repeat protein